MFSAPWSLLIRDRSSSSESIRALLDLISNESAHNHLDEFGEREIGPARHGQPLIHLRALPCSGQDTWEGLREIKVRIGKEITVGFSGER
jgi:hypothetical protein